MTVTNQFIIHIHPFETIWKVSASCLWKILHRLHVVNNSVEEINFLFFSSPSLSLIEMLQERYSTCWVLGQDARQQKCEQHFKCLKDILMFIFDIHFHVSQWNLKKVALVVHNQELKTVLELLKSEISNLKANNFTFGSPNGAAHFYLMEANVSDQTRQISQTLCRWTHEECEAGHGWPSIIRSSPWPTATAFYLNNNQC